MTTVVAGNAADRRSSWGSQSGFVKGQMTSRCMAANWYAFMMGWVSGKSDCQGSSRRSRNAFTPWRFSSAMRVVTLGSAWSR
jgi:hypothetical protein